MPIFSSPQDHRQRSPWISRCRAMAILLAIMTTACTRVPTPAATAMNPETFPQRVSPEIPLVPDNPPPAVMENKTFVVVDGVPMYRIGPGDVLDIIVTRGATQDKIQAIVRANGRINVPLSEVNVGGLTTDQAAQEISQKISAFFRRPTVDASVKEYNSKKISILGAIGHAGRGVVLPLMGRTTLIEAIARAGGFSPTARTEQVRITREEKTYTVNMYRYIQEGETLQEVIVDAGDVILIPERTRDEEQRIFVLGEVRSPGPVPFRPGMTLGQLVAQTGGWKEEALFEETRIIRADPNNPEIIGIDLGRLMLDGNRRIDQFLKPNDVIYIPRTPIANWNTFLAKLRPTFEFFSLPFQPLFTIKALEK